MPTNVAFLRGINVGAHNRMTMADLRALFESLGHGNVETYIQSGNVVFETAETDEATLRTDVEAAIVDEFGYDVTVMIRTRDALDAVVEGQPFGESDADAIRRYVTFLHEAPTDEQREALLAAGSDAERFEVSGREVYSELDKEALGSGRFTDVGATLGLPATRRNWDVTTAVHDLAGSPDE